MAKRLLVPTLLLWLSACGAATAPVPENPSISAPSDPLQVARAYFLALDAGDTERAGGLFAEDSSIFETGGVEGSWAHYLEHHLAPELQAVQSFATRLGESTAETSRDHSLAWVAWPVEYDIQLTEGRRIESAGTVTFVMALEDGGYRIRHLHWSSRRRKPSPTGH